MSDELRARWEVDPEPYDPGDSEACDHHFARGGFDADCAACQERKRDFWRYVNDHGVWGCIIEHRCPCCGEWSVVADLWGICGDDEYRADLEREMLEEACS